MLFINGTVFVPQQRSASYEEKSQSFSHHQRRRSSIGLNMDDMNSLDDCRTLGDAIHEPELFIEKDHSLDFICVICQCICNTPMDIGCKNGHIYCKQCLNSFFSDETNKKCPQCNDDVNRYGTRINHFALRLLLKLRIMCPFASIQCEDEKEVDMYQCEWIGCYSDIIEHLKHKCKYGTFIYNESIEKIKAKYHVDTKNNKKKQSSDNNNNNNNKNNNNPWDISRAEITSYKLIWEQLCEEDQNLGNHVYKATIQSYFRDTIHLNDNEIDKLWWIIGDCSDNLITENQFYAALHIARLHKNKYKAHCNLNDLYSLPICLNSRVINKVRYNINMCHCSASDLAQLQEAMQQKSIKKHDIINLDTKIGTMKELKCIAGIQSLSKQKTKTKTKNNDNMTNWNITKQQIDEYKKWFIKADENKDGYIDANEARKFFLKSKLTHFELAAIWSKIDHERNGKLTEAQFYAFFHIVMGLKRAKKTLPENFEIPLCLKESNIINIMNGGSNNNTNGDDWSLLFSNNSLSPNTNPSSVNHSTSSTSNFLDSLPPIFNNNNEISSSNSAAARARSDSIDSIHDWGDFNFQF